MRKLTLYPDDLRVESFDTLPTAAGLRRTVHGHQDATDARKDGDTDAGFTCDGGKSCKFECTDHTCETCPDTCSPPSCGATCLSGGPCCPAA
ncbi:MAG TPA: hypothetical protein VEX86_18915 [Longimicrobium sp.]|nr:hypothetical protein [Longimicrobium sp.]